MDHEENAESSDDLSTTGINPISTLALVHSELEQFNRNSTTRNPDSSDYQNPITGPPNGTFSTALGPHNPTDAQTRSQTSNTNRSNQVGQTTSGTFNLTGISIYLSTFKIHLIINVKTLSNP